METNEHPVVLRDFVLPVGVTVSSEIGNGPCNANGTPYINFSIGFTNDKQELFAWEAIWASITNLIGGRRGTLYWRKLPEKVDDEAIVDGELTKVRAVVTRVCFEEEKELAHAD